MNGPLGTIQVLRKQKGGWVGYAKCLRFLTWWVGLAKCLRNKKKSKESLKNRFSENTKLTFKSS